MSDHSEGLNRLSTETSPYLLQHADNPVHWYPWGEEAFEAACQLDKPIFLSVGYSTCHWCHVMAHESFEDATVAALMNGAFINIKVDREERPDVDAVYMAALQAMTGRGGWPMSVVMTPDKKPFYAATYIPRQSMSQRIGMLDLVPQISAAWETRREEIEKSTTAVMERLEQRNQNQGGMAPDAIVVDEAVSALLTQFDKQYGGFGQAPKFPSPHNMILILRESLRIGDQEAAEAVYKTLTNMRNGGLYDHLGDGFHRYSTDARWHLPHFEKMLYDQAMLLRAYTEAYQLGGQELFRRTVHEIADYLKRDLMNGDGVFSSAENADSEGEEGKFYTWPWEELEQVLDKDELSWLAREFQVDPGGNFHDEATREPSGMNILHLRADPEILSQENNLGLEAWLERWAGIRRKLLDIRSQRVRPSLDSKVLTDWNALTIASLAYAARVLDAAELLALATRAMKVLLDEHYNAENGLLHLKKAGQPVTAFLDDYAFMIWALRELYAATLDPDYLARAMRLQEEQLERFWDEERGGCWYTSERGEQLIVRQREIYDGAIPSGNSITAANLFALARLTGRFEWETLSNRLMESCGGNVRSMPFAYCALLWTAQGQSAAFTEYVISGEQADEMIRLVQSSYDPFSVLLYRNESTSQALAELAPFTETMRPLDSQPTVYICEDHACQQPSVKLTDLEQRLERFK